MLMLDGANRGQWFADTYPGRAMKARGIILHTTEGTSWPGYNGGGSAPHLTVLPNLTTMTLQVRQHLPLDRTARALVGAEANDWGVQIELVGTSGWASPANPARPYTVGFVWPSAPGWALDQLGALLRRIAAVTGTPLVAPWPFPAWNVNGRRTWAEFRQARGVIGHGHVPGNDHTDPGALPIARILSGGAPAPAPPSPQGRDWFDMATKEELIEAVGQALWGPVVPPWAGESKADYEKRVPTLLRSSWRNLAWQNRTLLEQIAAAQGVDVKELGRSIAADLRQVVLDAAQSESSPEAIADAVAARFAAGLQGSE